MKPPLLILAPLLLIIAGTFTSCKPDEPPPINYPIAIPFTELETQCQWTNLACDDKVMIINSHEELEKYITCTEGDYPAIDFSKHTLLLASGKTTGHIAEITVNDLKQLSSNKYKLNVEATSCNLTHIEPWSMALVVEKLNKKSHVELNVIHREIELELGLYKQVEPPFVIGNGYIDFIDKENVKFAVGFGIPEYFKYIIVRDSLQLTDSLGITNSIFFHIIHSAKFEMHVYAPPIPNPYIFIYEKR